MKKLLLTIATFVMAFGVSQSAHAATVTYNFTSCHITGGCGDATSYGTVTLTENGTGGVDFVVSLSGSEFFVATGAGDDQYFKFNNTNTDTVTENSALIQYNISSPLGTFCGDGGGCFSYGIGPQGGCAQGTCPLPVGTVLTFTVNNATIADLTTLNNLGNIFVADVNIAGNTGLIDVSTPPVTVPDGGSTAMLLGSALLGLGALRRRFSRF